MSFNAGFNNNINKIDFQSKTGKLSQKPATDNPNKTEKADQSSKLDLANKVDVNFSAAKSAPAKSVSFVDNNESISAKNTQEFKTIANVANMFDKNAVFNKLADNFFQAAGIRVE